VINIDSKQLQKHFADIPDPRGAQGQLHQLSDIILISILAVISGADDFTEIAVYGQAKEPWLKTFLELPNGIPSHDTFNAVFSVLKASLWQSRFITWAQELEIPPPVRDENGLMGDVLAIDGKTARRSRTADAHGLHTVSIWAANQGLVIAQLQVSEKSNEITAIPEIIEATCVAGGVITIDAMGCQKNIAWTIREHHADYVLGLKKNQPQLLETVEWMFDHADSIAWQGTPHDYFESVEQGHGRVETRRCWVISDLSLLEDRAAWRDLRCVVRIESTRVTSKGSSVERRYFLSSLPCDADLTARVIRAHWGIENCLHYMLDVGFAEDWSRARVGNAQANLVTVRHVALNLLRLDQDSRVGMKAKRKAAAWDENYLLDVLGFRL
jgi:predicted transposase YbfD/YdcC